MKHSSSRFHSFLCLAVALGSVTARTQAQSFTGASVNAQDNIFGAGHTYAPGGGNVPTGYAFTSGAGQILAFSSVTGSITFNNSNYNDADGIGSVSDTDIGSSAGIAGIKNLDHAGYLVGVFTNGMEPSDPAPDRLTFSDDGRNGSLATHFTSLSPLLNQSFFIGDGLTGDGAGNIQQFAVPTGATELFLGFADAGGYHGNPSAYGDNFGTLQVTFSIAGGTTAPAPSALLTAFIGIVPGVMLLRRRRK